MCRCVDISTSKETGGGVYVFGFFFFFFTMNTVWQAYGELWLLKQTAYLLFDMCEDK